MGARCVYCLDENISVSICLGCKSRLESAERELKELKKLMEVRRQQYWEKVNEMKRTMGRKR